MATPPHIEVTFDPPSASDTDSVFDTKASDTVGKLNPWGTEANDLADWIGTKADQALAAATGGDLPSLTGYGDQFLKVKTDETAAEFTNYTSPENIEDLGGITFSEGDLLYHDGTNLVNLGKGTAGQKLTMNSGATAPEWVEDYVDAWMNAKWVDKSGIRSGGVEYTNNNNFPLEVSIRDSSGNNRAEVSADGGTTWVFVGGNGATGANSSNFNVPPGHLYKYPQTPTDWSERDG